MIQKVENKTIERNVTQTVTFTVVGNYSSDTIYFTAKKTSKVSDTTRLIDHLCDTQTYDSETGLTTLEFDLVPSETSAIDERNLFYDVLKENSSTDHEILIKGGLYVTQGYRLDSDEAPAEATPIVSLNANDFDAESYFKVEDDGSGTNNVFVPKTIAEMKADLGLPSSIVFPVKTYKAFVNASGTNNPTITVIANNFDDTITITRQDVGVFSITSNSSEFTNNKTISQTQAKVFLTANYVGITISSSIISCLTFNGSGTLTDSIDFWITIEVYE